MTKPYYDEAGIQIWLGDCREILPSLKACCRSSSYAALSHASGSALPLAPSPR